MNSVLTELHGGLSGGYLGVSKNQNKAQHSYYWLHARNDVEKWCWQCDTCAASCGTQTKNWGQMHQYNIKALHKRIAINVVGLFPWSDQGNSYLLIAMYYFTKWPEAYTIPNEEALTIVEILVTNFFCRLGVPRELHSDQGHNFEFHLMQEVLQLSVNRTPHPLHLQLDSMVRTIRQTVKEHLRQVIASHLRDWDARLPLFFLPNGESTHDTTVLTQLPCDLLFGASPTRNNLQLIMWKI
jgi:hypothetical protein